MQNVVRYHLCIPWLPDFMVYGRSRFMLQVAMQSDELCAFAADEMWLAHMNVA